MRVQGELFRLLEHEHLANAVVLVLANKQDLRVRRLLVPFSLVPPPGLRHVRKIVLSVSVPHSYLMSLQLWVCTLDNMQCEAQDAMTVQELSEVLALHTVRHHDWHIQAACALKGEGLYEGLEWIAQRVAHLPAGS